MFPRMLVRYQVHTVKLFRCAITIFRENKRTLNFTLSSTPIISLPLEDLVA